MQSSRQSRSFGNVWIFVYEDCQIYASQVRLIVVDCCAMRGKREYKVGDRIQISLNNRIMDATVKAIIETTVGLRLQVDFGNEQTALIREWQLVPESPRK